MIRRLVTIPACVEHEGIASAEVLLPWTCIHCGGPRGEPVPMLSFDGSRRLEVHGWANPCGHLERYAEVRDWIRAQPAGAVPVRVAFGGVLA